MFGPIVSPIEEAGPGGNNVTMQLLRWPCLSANLVRKSINHSTTVLLCKTLSNRLWNFVGGNQNILIANFSGTTFDKKGHFEVLDWFKSYGLRCSRRPHASSVNFKKIATDKWLFYNHIRSFLANYMFIFHKTEIQTVILRCLMSLNLNWYKSYGTKRKNSKNANLCFWTKCKKRKWKYFLFVS